MSTQVYPFKFDPIYQYRLWGGRRLEHFLSKPLPEDELVGEAWILSDRKDHSNLVTEGELKGWNLSELMKSFRYEIMGKIGNQFDYFPLLLKFLDCRELLSVQVHPADNQLEYIPDGDTGKTEAWVVLETTENSIIYAGLKKGTDKESLMKSIKEKTVSDRLHSFTPNKGDAIFIKSGTVHTLGGTVVFEVQENSDTTFRLYDWDRTDPKRGKPRELQVDKAIDCIDFNQINIGPIVPEKSEVIENAELLFDNEHFKVWRIISESQFKIGLIDEPTILVCIDGKGITKFKNGTYSIKKGEVMLLPAIIGQLDLNPQPEITLLQIGISDMI